MAKIVYLICLVLLAATITLAADDKKEKSCSPWLGSCQGYEDCCRHLACATYMAKCVPIGGVLIRMNDTRPTGPGPFPPGYIA